MGPEVTTTAMTPQSAPARGGRLGRHLGPSWGRRVRRFLLVPLAVVAVLALALAGLRPHLRGLITAALTPSEPFAAQTPGPAPDYGRAENWAALPDRPDGADRVWLPGTKDRQGEAEADVFFLYAGSNLTARWNQAVDHWLVTRMVDGALMPLLASVFNGCCRIYAPRYRQEAILRNPAFEDDRKRAVAFAFEDVRRAFRHYVEHENDGRPLVIAGANSGARHALRLLIEEVAGTPLQQRLVAAYLVAAGVDAEAREQLGSIPICSAPEQTGCVSVYSAIGRQLHEQDPPPPERRDGACVNPLSWRADGEHVGREHNSAGINTQFSLFFGGEARVRVVPQMADAQCQDGRLLVTPTARLADLYQPFGPGDYHSLNIQLYYQSLRDNARARVEAFQTRQGATAECPPGERRRALAGPHPGPVHLTADGCAAAAPSKLPGSLGSHWPGALPAALRLD